MANPGAFPLNATSAVGQLRVLVGDTASTPLDPPVTGQASYAIWSDVALEAALGLAADSIYRAAANLYFSLAAEYAQRGRSIKTDDLSLDTTKRGSDLITIARAWISQADTDDAGNDFFQIVGFNPAADRNPFWPIADTPTALPASPAASLVPGWIPDPSNPGYLMPA